MKVTVKGKRPRGPKGLPVLGNLLARTKDPLGFFTKIYREYGDFVHIPMLNIQVYLVSNPELIRKVLLSKEIFIKGTSYNGLRKFIGDGILTSNKSRWVGQRKYLTSFFLNDKLQSYQKIFMGTLNEYLQEFTAPESTFDLKQEMVSITVENVSRSIFGVKVGRSRACEISRLVTNMAQLSAKYTFRLIKFPDWVPTSLNKNIQRTQTRLFNLIDELFADVYKSPPDAMASLPQEELRQQIITLFLAGHETTATTLVWALWHLAKDHHLQKECCNEAVHLNRELGAPNFQEKFPLITSVINECLRLYPPIWTIPRQVEQDTELGGYKLKKGEIIVISPYILGRSKIFWTDPERFDGKRFLQPEGINKFIHLPFSRGPRSCMGEDFAMIEMIMTICRVLEFHQLQVLTPAEFNSELLDPAVTLRQRGDFRIKLNLRATLASYQSDLSPQS